MYQLFQCETEKGTILFIAPTQCSIGEAYEASCKFKSHFENMIKEHKEKVEKEQTDG